MCWCTVPSNVSQRIDTKRKRKFFCALLRKSNHYACYGEKTLYQLQIKLKLMYLYITDEKQTQGTFYVLKNTTCPYPLSTWKTKLTHNIIKLRRVLIGGMKYKNITIGQFEMQLQN